MKKLLIFLAAICSALTLFSACEAREAGSIKSLTRPYIAQYECTSATLGGENLLDSFEYITIVLADKSEMQFIYKPKGGEKHIYKSEYTFDDKTHSLTAEIGILGYSIKENVTVENGKFTISKSLGGRQLIMNFKAK